MSGTVKTRHLVLGLLSQQPMSGYDIKRFFKSLSWLIGSPSFGSLYPALHALLEEGLVTVEVIPREGKPPRKLYSVTDAGRESLLAWMSRPAGSGVSLKSFVMRLAISGSLSHAELRGYLKHRHEQVSADRRTVVDTVQSLGEGADVGKRLTLDYALALADAELGWLERTLAVLSEEVRATTGEESSVAPVSS